MCVKLQRGHASGLQGKGGRDGMMEGALGRGLELKMRERPQLLQLDFQRYPLLQQVLEKEQRERERP